MKRLNNIHKENEIFAKRIIKVPFRLFTQQLPEVHKSGRNSPKENLPNTSKVEDLICIESDLQTKLLNVPEKENNEVNYIIFNTNIAQIPKQSTDEVETCAEIEEQISLLPQKNSETVKPINNSWLNWNGADFGISWVALIVCILIVIFIVPLIYVFYIAEHPANSHSTFNKT